MKREVNFTEGSTFFLDKKGYLLKLSQGKLKGILPFHEGLTGNIYLGRVEHVDKGLGAAFVNIGEEKNGFLPLKGAHLHRGDTVVVEVKKDPVGQKGPLLTMEYSIRGEYVIYFPEEDFFHLSAKVSDVNLKRFWKREKDRLPKGILVRTKGGKRPKEVRSELGELIPIGEEIIRNKNFLPVPRCLYERSRIRDFLREHREEKNGYFTNDNTLAKSGAFGIPWIFVDRSMDTDPVLVKELRYLFTRRVPLPSGGELVIDETESCTVIDVNTGSAAFSYEETTKVVNFEAAREVVRQILLRNLSGIILVDFITGEEEEEITELLKEGFSSDRNTTVYGFTKLHLMEIGRRKRGNPLK